MKQQFKNGEMPEQNFGTLEQNGTEWNGGSTMLLVGTWYQAYKLV